MKKQFMLAVAIISVVFSTAFVTDEKMIDSAACGTPSNVYLTLVGSSTPRYQVVPNTQYVVWATGGTNNIMICMEPGAGYTVASTGCDDTTTGLVHPVGRITTRSNLSASGITIMLTATCSFSPFTESMPITKNFPKQ